MWYLKTRSGTFWIIPAEDSDRYWLGIDEDPLGCYTDASEAAHDVSAQQTGHDEWDNKAKVKVPEDLEQWISGEPDEWH